MVNREEYEFSPSMTGCVTATLCRCRAGIAAAAVTGSAGRADSRVASHMGDRSGALCVHLYACVFVCVRMDGLMHWVIGQEHCVCICMHVDYVCVCNLMPHYCYAYYLDDVRCAARC